MTKKVAVNRRRVADGSRSSTDGNARRHDAKDEIRAKLKSRKSSSPLTKFVRISSAKLWFIAASGIAIGILLYLGMKGFKNYQRNIVRTACPLEPLANESTTSWRSDPERYWGTYRPQVFFGMRTRSKHSMLFGIAYFLQPKEMGPPQIRHLCRDSNDLRTYSWTMHDGRHFGVEEIVEEQFTMHISFLKRTANTQFGGEWTVRIRVTPHNDTASGLSDLHRERLRETLLSLFAYFYVPGDGSVHYNLSPNITITQNVPLSSSVADDVSTKRNTVANWLDGVAHDIGPFRAAFGHDRAHVDYMLTYLADPAHFNDLLRTPQFYTVRRTLDSASRNYLALRGATSIEGAEYHGQPNFFVYQVSTYLADLLPNTKGARSGPEPTLEVVYSPASAEWTNEPSRLIGETFEKEFLMRTSAFETRFERTFRLTERGFTPADVRMAQRVFSNLLGGVGYFYGTSLVRSNYIDSPSDYMEYWPAALYSAVPARGQFPRGFLWDEGFHQLLIQEWDAEISVDCVKHWLSLMNVEGWIPREQILGSEARALVPSDFIVQHNENANPPALLIAIERLFGRLGLLNKQTVGHGELEDQSHRQLLAKHFPESVLRNLYMRLRAWVDWYVYTQRGATFNEEELAGLQDVSVDGVPVASFDGERMTFRWRGRDASARRELNPKTLTSGLDDYPRASHPTENERHLDLRCWVQFAADFMARFSSALDSRFNPASQKQSQNASFIDREQYASLARVLRDNHILKALHWNAKRGFYADYGLHTDGLKLDWVTLARQGGGVGQRSNEPQREFVRVVNSEPHMQHVTSFGYVSLFPLLFHILDPNDQTLEQTLNSIRDEKLLWTPYGLRSLARNSPYYQKHNTQDDPPYWRGTVWININYLTVCALQHYSHSDSPYAKLAGQLYSELRQNLMRNMLSELRRTGYVFEQYDDSTGHGKGAAPFTGWSSLLVLIMAEIC